MSQGCILKCTSLLQGRKNAFRLSGPWLSLALTFRKNSSFDFKLHKFDLKITGREKGKKSMECHNTIFSHFLYFFSPISLLASTCSLLFYT